jgi:NADPH2:quinone reductase
MINNQEKEEMKAIRISKPGGVEEMRFEELATPEPNENQALVKVAASGVNFIDVYQRTGLYPVKLPYILGLEAAGVVEKIGSGVAQFKPGDRVAFCGVPGSYAEFVVAPVERLVSLPEEIDLNTGAAAMLQGMTAHYLTRDTYRLKPGDRCLIHAAAGGAGLLLVQMAKLAGAFVIGTVSTESKAQLAREAGADEIILYTEKDFEPEVMKITNGKGVNVIYDSVGQATFLKGLNCISRRGMMVLFGQSSGPVEKIDPLILNTKGSLFLTRPSLFHYIAERAELTQRAQEFFGWIKDGKIKVRIDKTFALKDAAAAHRYLESRQSRGKILLTPNR